MAVIKETQIELDEHNDSEHHRTAVESANDSTAIKVENEGHNKAKVSQTFGATNQCFNRYLVGDYYKTMVDTCETTWNIANMSRVIQGSEAALETQEERAHEAEKQKAREKTQEKSRQHRILLKRMWESYNKRKDMERKRVEEEAEKEAEATEKRLKEMKKKAREAEKKAWEKKAWNEDWTLRRLAEKTKYEEDSVRDKTERIQKLEKRTLDAEKKIQEEEKRIEEAEEEFLYWS
jgi:hypothetical protein